MIQQGQVFKLRRRALRVSRCGPIGTGTQDAARRGGKSVGSRHTRRRSGHCARFSTGLVQGEERPRSLSATWSTSTSRCIMGRR